MIRHIKELSKRQPAQIYSFLLSSWLSVTNPKTRCCCSICNLSCAHNCNLQNPTTELSVCVICHTKNRKILGACCYTNNNPLPFNNQSYISLKTYIHHTFLMGIVAFLTFNGSIELLLSFHSCFGFLYPDALIHFLKVWYTSTKMCFECYFVE